MTFAGAGKTLLLRVSKEQYSREQAWGRYTGWRGLSGSFLRNLNVSMKFKINTMKSLNLIIIFLFTVLTSFSQFVVDTSVSYDDKPYSNVKKLKIDTIIDERTRYISFTDNRDGKTYNSIKIAEQVWMAENLAYKPDSGNYLAYDKDEGNVIYGFLYDYATAMKVCPVGWHLPSDEEWRILEKHTGDKSGTKLKSTSAWENNGNGSNSFGFNAIPAGWYSGQDHFDFLGYYSCWWTSTAYSSTLKWEANQSWMRGLDSRYSWVDRRFQDRSYGLSVRCVKD